MTSPADPQGEVWIVLFGHGRLRHSWWQRWLAPGYRHVMTLRAVMPGLTLAVQHVGSRTLTEIHHLPIDQVAGIHLREGGASRALRLCLPPANPAAMRPMLRPMLSCVELTKALLGIAAPHIVTPRQLAAQLRRQGAIEWRAATTITG